MPFATVAGAEGRKTCPDPNCRGHAPRRASVELRVQASTIRVGDGPVVINHAERVPITVAEVDRVCEFCGQPNEVGQFTTGPDQRLRWPVPHVSPGMTADEVVPVPGREEMTLEERIEALERAVLRLGGQI